MKKKNQKIVAGVIAGALLIAGIGALGGASKGFKDWDTNNWKQNLEDVFKKDEEQKDDATTKKVEAIDVDQTDANQVYMMPSGSVNFGVSSIYGDSQLVESESIVSRDAGAIGVMSMAKGDELHTMANSTSSIQSIQLVATLTPENADLDKVEWSLDGITNMSDYLEITYPKGTDTLANKLTIQLNVKKAFTQVATLKVVVGKNGLTVSDTCNVNYYKQYQGLDLVLTGNVADKTLDKGDLITYDLVESYSDGTIDQKDNSTPVIAYTSLIDTYTINYDFKKNETTAFDYGVFYNSNGNFTGVEVLSGAGRNIMNAKLTSCSGDFKITATKGKYSDSEILDVAPEGVTYPESVKIGDGTDVEIGKN